MTKGKYATRADKIQAATEVLTEVQSYQHAVRRLTAERDQARADAAQWKQRHADDVRSLRAQLDADLSLEVHLLRTELSHDREELGIANSQAAAAWEQANGMIRRLQEELKRRHFSHSDAAKISAAVYYGNVDRAKEVGNTSWQNVDNSFGPAGREA